MRIFEGQADAVRRKGTRRHTFAHNEKNLVKTGAQVAAGQDILVMGDTGNAAFDSQGKHVHYQVDEWDGSRWVNVDPTPWCGGSNTAALVWFGADAPASEAPQEPAPAPEPAPDAGKLAVGREITLEGVSLYADAYTGDVANTLPDPGMGVVNPFYIHGVEVNGRVPITNNVDLAAMDVDGENTTGYIGVDDVPEI